MIEVEITPDMIARAERRLSRVQLDGGRASSKFGSESGRILTGYLGEQVAIEYFEIDVTQSRETFDYDLILKGKRIEVKSISCKFKPRDHYLCTVNSHDPNGVHKQGADYYLFIRILNDNTRAWLLGYMACDEFFRKGQFIEKGKNITDDICFEKANATVLPISKLHKLKRRDK